MTATGDDTRTRRDLVIAPLTAHHADEVLAIYQRGLDTGEASFDTTAPDWAIWDEAHLPHHRLVAVDRVGGEVLGWTAVSQVSERRVYAGVVEASTYIRPEARSRGVGSALLRALIHSTEEAGIWTVQASIFPENTDSIALHRAHSFRIVGLRERIGRHGGQWRDVLLLERRSPTVG